jgi:hypothetical protein
MLPILPINTMTLIINTLDIIKLSYPILPNPTLSYRNTITGKMINTGKINKSILPNVSI